jgi:hypothetical protein
LRSNKFLVAQSVGASEPFSLAKKKPHHSGGAQCKRMLARVRWTLAKLIGQIKIGI